MSFYTFVLVLLYLECNHILGYKDIYNSVDVATPNSITSEDIQFSKLRAPPRIDNDNHKPIFVNCSTYAPSIVEEGERGQFVIQVQATDTDPSDSGGTLNYTIVAREHDRKYFSINPRTGEITTNTVFDRDEPSRMKEFWLTVQAADNGRPVLVDICTFKITITDINDNPPNIDGRNEASVVEDLKVNSEVMRVFAYDIDDGDNARLTYTLRPSDVEFSKYFRIDPDTGVIYLKESLNAKKGELFNAQIAVHDNPKTGVRRESNGEITIRVVSSEKKSPSFGNFPRNRSLPENFNDYDNDIITLEAFSNIDNPQLQFELVKGKTTQTNKDSTFILAPFTNTSRKVSVKLARNLDYETVTEYTLTVRVTNKDSLQAIVPIHITVEDVNDEIPTFNELIYGSVLENEEPGAEVMQVKAVDLDGTSANNIVSYKLDSEQDKFEINPQTGKVTTKIRFDREEESVYNVLVIAKDNSISALTKLQEPNSITQSFRVNIEDRNDNPPRFEKTMYTADSILESADVGKDVIIVLANDKDTAALITYNITEGNIDNAFSIERTTGRIKVASPLDYETHENYTLVVWASDGVYSDQAEVQIFITDVNDELPRFEPYQNKTIFEESIPDDCLISLKAYDPDIKDRSAPQRIVYRIKNEQENRFITIGRDDGCVRLTEALDRDPPNGFTFRQVYILAYDDDDSPTAQSKEAEWFLFLDDINDNAPILNLTEVVWYENEPIGTIVQLTAYDYDTNPNGPPFSYSIDSSSDNNDDYFEIVGDLLKALVVFDREKRKYYDVRIRIEDNGSPMQSGISVLRVIIGDRNDNDAKDGESEIFVYNYHFPAIEIGRVYVDDLDDWDLADKNFRWATDKNTYFGLDEATGTLTMFKDTPSGTYQLDFEVTEARIPSMPNIVHAVVIVTVQDLPEEAVQKSGSSRINDTSAELFVEKRIELSGNSSRELMQQQLSVALNTSLENVHVFTVMDKDGSGRLTDVRYSAHGSPYYERERMDAMLTDVHKQLETELLVHFVEVGINECMMETACPSETSCSNVLDVDNENPAVVFTNRTSFVGVNATYRAQCGQEVYPPFSCYNGGTANEGSVCTCPDAIHEGPHCEILNVGFTGNGWALYRPLPAWAEMLVRVEIHAVSPNGLIFYVGPYGNKPPPLVQDFLSLELKDGYPVVLVDYGSGTVRIEAKHKYLVDDTFHSITISLKTKEIQMSVDDSTASNRVVLRAPIGSNAILNVNGPLQLGGLRNKDVIHTAGWTYRPTDQGFSGCIRNLTYNKYTYNLGSPSEAANAIPNCSYGVLDAQFGIDSNFLVAILTCIGILIILLVAVVYHRTKQDYSPEKDPDETRDNIISYEDEGGGEGDAEYNPDVLQVPGHGQIDDDGKQYHANGGLLYQQSGDGLMNGLGSGPDIKHFLVKQKDSCDRDGNSQPYDDVRHYAYEGDGNSTGSLSSLASCTDDGDLKFKYLSNFGPRFRKLADMYGEDPSDEDSQDGGEESWC